MNIPLRSSPIQAELNALGATWREINGMKSAWTIPPVEDRSIRLADVSCLTRFGVKGAGAASWLQDQRLPIPDRPNTWKSISNNGLIARLGISEFLIEDGIDGRIAELMQQSQLPPRVYPVLRQDLAIVLCGESRYDLLNQTCSVNFRALPSDAVVLTSIVGVSAIVLFNADHCRIWCDGTFGSYFWRTLLEIAEDLGGGAIGVAQIF